jgi:hypothetical protein
MHSRKVLATIVASGMLLAVWPVWTVKQQAAAQQPAAEKVKVEAKDGFKFEVIQSFNARYAGDTPGHIGKSGGLGDQRPRVALGDAVFRGEERVGTVTGLTWSRASGSLEVEFDPAEKVRICVGDEVWLDLGTANPAR